MKIIVNLENDKSRSDFYLNYMRDVFPERVNDIILIAILPTDEFNKWASEQTDITYIYFEEPTTAGSAFNQVIEGLALEDDVLIMDDCHIPLANSFDYLEKGLITADKAFAVGPVSNSFNYLQRVEWADAEEAMEWSGRQQESEPEETLGLHNGVIFFSRAVIDGRNTFDDKAGNVFDMVIEKCIRGFLDHGRMYICRNSAFWDVRGSDYRDNQIADIDLLEKNFGIHYLNLGGNALIIDDVLNLFDADEEVKILEIGCDCGGTLFRIKKTIKNAELYGTDINENALKFAAEFATVKAGNIENKDLDFGVNNFDVIIFGDVLEHLRDPLGVLIFCKKLLKTGGRIVASIPNLMNIEVMRLLLNGDFTYAEYGLLDKTHIHMFTFNEIKRMFVDDAGYTIEKMSMNGELSPENDRLADELLKLGKAEKFMYQAYQFQVVARFDG
ncbi:MAG: methyltransferase [Lachnospiraceae bacterium]|nr:methyltransferase [Lachnospiraceae bacterium]